MSPAPIILWFRRDLRLEDHAALSEALKGGSPILPLYIHETETVPSMGAASQWWLHHALQAHEARLRAVEARLIVRQGDPAEVLAKLIAETGAKAENTSADYGFGSAQQYCRQTHAGEEADAGDGRTQSHELLRPPCAEQRGEQCGRQRRQYRGGQGSLRDSA